MPADHFASRAGQGNSRGRLAIVLAFAVLMLCSSVLAAYSWSHPLRTVASLPYVQSGQLSYSAPGGPSSLYGTAGLTTGQPVYTNQVQTLHVGYSYRFHSNFPVSVVGTEQLVATISNGQGITRTLPLQPVTPFTGTHFQAAGSLSIPALQAVAAAFDQAAANQPQGTYIVGIEPSVKIHGRLGSTALNTAFTAPVQFQFDTVSLTPGEASPSTGINADPSQSAIGGSGTGQQSFAPSESGSVTVPAGRLATAFLGVPVIAARVGSLVIIAASLLVVVLVGRGLLDEATSTEERVRIAARYGSSLVEAESLPSAPRVVTVELSSFEGLMHVARRLECPVLHRSGDGDVYAVVDSGTLYSYRLAARDSDGEALRAVAGMGSLVAGQV